MGVASAGRRSNRDRWWDPEIGSSEDYEVCCPWLRVTFAFCSVHNIQWHFVHGHSAGAHWHGVVAEHRAKTRQRWDWRPHRRSSMTPLRTSAMRNGQQSSGR